MAFRTRIKFCGMMRAEDALAAARLGVDAVGLVFYSAAGRRVTVEQAREIVSVLPPFVTPVGLFVNSGVDEVREVAGQLGLGHVQLHGNEPPEMVAKLRGLKVIKAVQVEKDTLKQSLDNWQRAIAEMAIPNLTGLLLETGGAGAPGGTGVENDWETIAQAQAADGFAGLPPLIAAGGLTPGNVGAVVRLLRPWAVDVSSGIEASRGVKSLEKMGAFVDAVRQANSEK